MVLIWIVLIDKAVSGRKTVRAGERCLRVEITVVARRLSVDGREAPCVHKIRCSIDRVYAWLKGQVRRSGS